jgi:Na+-translocating ferredoxin:NAD+ oxidoreductase subunit G
MKEIIKITASLTAVCVVSALILGAVYAKTEHARHHIEEQMKEETRLSLLGFGPDEKAPSDLKIYSVYRYVLQDDKGQTLLAYLIPLKDKGYTLAEIDLEGKPGKVVEIKAEASELNDQGTRDKAIVAALPNGYKATYAETIYVADQGGKRLGYVLTGVTQGFKTFVSFMVSLTPEYTIKGVAVTKHEEDPGLGAEITQDYFKNQFIGKTADMLKTLDVVKEPLPADYLPALEPAKAKKAGLTPEQLKEIRAKHLKDNIYALTGATISSKALTVGVKGTVRKFVYRLGILNEVIKQDNLKVAF